MINTDKQIKENVCDKFVNPLDPAQFIYLNFQPLQAVSRYRDPQPQVVENYSYLFILRPNIYKSFCLYSYFSPQ